MLRDAEPDSGVPTSELVARWVVRGAGVVLVGFFAAPVAALLAMLVVALMGLVSSSGPPGEWLNAIAIWCGIGFGAGLPLGAIVLGAHVLGRRWIPARVGVLEAEVLKRRAGLVVAGLPLVASMAWMVSADVDTAKLGLAFVGALAAGLPTALGAMVGVGLTLRFGPGAVEILRAQDREQVVVELDAVSSRQKVRAALKLLGFLVLAFGPALVWHAESGQVPVLDRSVAGVVAASLSMAAGLLGAFQVFVRQVALATARARVRLTPTAVEVKVWGRSMVRVPASELVLKTVRDGDGASLVVGPGAVVSVGPSAEPVRRMLARLERDLTREAPSDVQAAHASLGRLAPMPRRPSRAWDWMEAGRFRAGIVQLVGPTVFLLWLVGRMSRGGAAFEGLIATVPAAFLVAAVYALVRSLRDARKVSARLCDPEATGGEVSTRSVAGWSGDPVSPSDGLAVRRDPGVPVLGGELGVREG